MVRGEIALSRPLDNGQLRRKTDIPSQLRKRKKKVTGELSLVDTENTVFLFPVLSFSSWTPTRTSKHELTRESYQH